MTTGLASLAAIDAAAAEHAKQGRSGMVSLRDAIADWSIDDKPADSVLESIMARLIRRYDLPPVEFHPVIAGREVDFRVTDTPVILECDGWAYHGLDRATFERDRGRDADLTAAGWIVVRFTYRAITTRPKATADRILAALDRWTPSTGLAPFPPDAA
jgi:very-short-patch-repair endonuclease